MCSSDLETNGITLQASDGSRATRFVRNLRVEFVRQPDLRTFANLETAYSVPADGSSEGRGITLSGPVLFPLTAQPTALQHCAYAAAAGAIAAQIVNSQRKRVEDAAGIVFALGDATLISAVLAAVGQISACLETGGAEGRDRRTD